MGSNENRTHRQYSWDRFWVPRGEHWLSDSGFLFDPESEHARFYPNCAIDLSSVRDKPVLILLGEAGIGKSTAILAEAKLAEQTARQNEYLYLSINLNQYADESRLIREIFESAPFTAYGTGTQPLHLFLDSFDECRLGIPHLSTLLGSELKKRVIQPERLFLRVASRSGDWPANLEQTLREVWRDTDGNSVGVLELCPLRRQDAEVAACAEGLDAEAFLKAVEQREVQSFACRPKTLRFLLKEFERKKDLPRQKVDLYERGCLDLCEEDPIRVEAGHGGHLTAPERLRIAARVVVALLVGNRAAIWLGSSLDKSDEDVALDELVGEEHLDGRVLSVNLAALRETLTHTGLFRQISPQRLRFDHQSDAEFLAARYIARAGMSTKQMLMLLCHPEDGRLVPQLHETVAWLASMNREVFEYVLKTEPDVLLASDVSTADVQAKHRLVDRLLVLYQAEECFSRLRHDHLRKLAHPGLFNQLLPYIRGKTKKDRARDLAIELAMACRVHSLQDALLKVALDKRESYGLRVDAAEALAEVADAKTRQRLRPLIHGKAGEDPADRLKGFALKAMWPEHLTAVELFQVLTPKKERQHFGAYDRFIGTDLPETIGPEHLPDALRWIETQPPSWKADFALKGLVDDLMQVAWDHFETPDIPSAFARAAISRLRQHDGLFERRGKREDRDRLSEVDKRRRLLVEMIPLIEEKDVHLLVWQVIREDDARWLLGQYQNTTDRRQRMNMAAILARLIGWRTSPDLVNTILDICGCHAVSTDLVLRRALSWLTHPMRLKSTRTKEARRSWKEQKRWEKKHKERPLKPPPAQRVVKAIEQCETGDLNAWPGLAMELTLEDNSRYYEWPGKLFDQPGWKKADDSTRQRILRVALAFLRSSAPDSDGLFEKTSHSVKDFGGGFAFELLARVAAERLLELTAEDLARWSSLIVLYHFDDNEIEQNLYRLAHSPAPDSFLKAIVRRVDKYNRERPDALCLADFDCAWSERLGELLSEKLNDGDFHLNARRQLLEFLLRHEFQPAREYAKAMIQSDRNFEERSFAASLLLTWDESYRRELLLSLLKGDKKFAREVFLNLAFRSRFGDSNPFVLDEDLSATLYIWLEQEFPLSKDPKHDGAYTPSARDHVADFRDRLLNRLRSLGTPAARDATRKIVSAFPGRNWLKQVLQETESNARRTTWQAPAPHEIFTIAVNQKARLVRSELELLDAIVDSLHHLQSNLQGETPLAPFLWNEARSKTTYKRENRLSDFIKYHLKQDLNRRGVLVSREVEVHNWPGRGRGESVDLLVQSPLPDEAALTVVIEVKGCWNSEWSKGMATQLRDRYLLGAGHRCGIHLVGWYGGDQCWKGMGFEEMSLQLAQQADELSRDGLKINPFTLDVSLRARRPKIRAKERPKRRGTQRSIQLKRRSGRNSVQ